MAGISLEDISELAYLLRDPVCACVRCVGGWERMHGKRGGNHSFCDPCVQLWRDLEHCVCVRRQFLNVRL